MAIPQGTNVYIYLSFLFFCFSYVLYSNSFSSFIIYICVYIYYCIYIYITCTPTFFSLHSRAPFSSFLIWASHLTTTQCTVKGFTTFQCLEESEEKKKAWMRIYRYMYIHIYIVSFVYIWGKRETAGSLPIQENTWKNKCHVCAYIFLFIFLYIMMNENKILFFRIILHWLKILFFFFLYTGRIFEYQYYYPVITHSKAGTYNNIWYRKIILYSGVKYILINSRNIYFKFILKNNYCKNV